MQRRTVANDSILVLLSLSILFLCFAMDRAEAKAPFGVPVSDRVVTLQISHPGMSEPAQVQVRDGSMLTISNRDEGYSFGIAAAIRKDEADMTTVKLLALELIEKEGQRTHIEQFANVELTPDSPAWISKEGMTTGFEVTLGEIGQGRFLAEPLLESSRFSPSELRKIYGTTGGTCCVTCGPFTICGDSVSLSCGSCDGGWSY